jgi:hypothetical protein
MTVLQHPLVRCALLIAIAGALCFQTLAAPAPTGGPPTFAEFDQNNDGRIDEREFNEARGKRMTERAKQGGQLRNAAKAPRFSQVDSDGDGAISPQEWARHQADCLRGCPR